MYYSDTKMLLYNVSWTTMYAVFATMSTNLYLKQFSNAQIHENDEYNMKSIGQNPRNLKSNRLYWTQAVEKLVNKERMGCQYGVQQVVY